MTPVQGDAGFKTAIQARGMASESRFRNSFNAATRRSYERRDNTAQSGRQESGRTEAQKAGENAGS